MPFAVAPAAGRSIVTMPAWRPLPVASPRRTRERDRVDRGQCGGHERLQARDAFEAGTQRRPFRGAVTGGGDGVALQTRFEFADPFDDRGPLGVGQRQFDADFEAVGQVADEYDRTDETLRTVAQRHAQLQERGDRQRTGCVEAEPEIMASRWRDRVPVPAWQRPAGKGKPPRVLQELPAEARIGAR